MDLLRASLGHPLYFLSSTVRCVISGVHGLDAGSCNERFVVATRLWAEGMYVVDIDLQFSNTLSFLIYPRVSLSVRQNTLLRVVSWRVYSSTSAKKHKV